MAVTGQRPGDPGEAGHLGPEELIKRHTDLICAELVLLRHTTSWWERHGRLRLWRRPISLWRGKAPDGAQTYAKGPGSSPGPAALLTGPRTRPWVLGQLPTPAPASAVLSCTM